MWQVILIAAVALANGQQRICMQLEAVGDANGVMSERPDLRGMPGEKGTKGDVGPPGIGIKGNPGIVDYERIFAVINQKFNAFERTMQERIEEFEDKVAVNISKKLDVEAFNRHTGCSTIYSNHCFRLVLHTSSDINIEESKNICAETGGHPANIYDETHWTVIKSMIRQGIPSGSSYLFVWTGMQVNTETNSVTLYDGSSAPFIKWRASSFPNQNEDHIYLKVDRDSSATGQGYGNDPATSTMLAVLCEKA